MLARTANVRVLFALVWVTGQLALVLTASRRPDGLFGFRMFPESSTVAVTLYRDVTAESGVTMRLPVKDGAWIARGKDGAPHAFAWKDRVKRPELSTFDAEMHASYGAAAQIARWQAALDDVATHLDADAETRRLAVELTVRRNGHEPRVVRLESPERR